MTDRKNHFTWEENDVSTNTSDIASRAFQRTGHEFRDNGDVTRTVEIRPVGQAPIPSEAAVPPLPSAPQPPKSNSGGK